MTEYKLIEESGQVLIEREPDVWTHFDMQYHLKVTADKSSIAADGADTSTITVEVFDYLDAPQITDGIEITVKISRGSFVLEDMLTTVTGKVAFEFDSETV